MNAATPELHLCIATGQNLANLIPALQCGAREVWVLQTPEMRVRAGFLADALKARGITVQRIDFADDDVSTLQSQAIDIAMRLAGRAVTINLTGGTKLMTLALTETLADQLEFGSQAAPIHLVYTDTRHHRLDWLRPLPARSEPMADVLHLNDILFSQGYRQQAASGGADAAAAQRAADDHKSLTKFLGDEAKGIEWAFGDLNRIAQRALNEGAAFMREQSIDWPPNHRHVNQLRRSLQRIADAGGLLHWDGQRQVVFESADAAKYLCGGWVEEYAASKVKGYAADHRASPLWIESVQGATRNELDAVLVHGNRLLVIECKAANTRNDDKLSDWIYKINQLARDVGGQMAQPLLLSARSIGDAPRQRAKEYGVDILAAAELATLPDYLRRWMAS